MLNKFMTVFAFFILAVNIVVSYGHYKDLDGMLAVAEIGKEMTGALSLIFLFFVLMEKERWVPRICIAILPFAAMSTLHADMLTVTIGVGMFLAASALIFVAIKENRL